MKPPTKFLVETYRFQTRFRLMCNARALLDCMLIIIEPTVDYGFHKICEFRRVLEYHLAEKSGNFSSKPNGTAIFWEIHSEIVDYLQR